MASTFETVFESEVLVVGGGLAGMLAALEASMEGASVAPSVEFMIKFS